MSKVQLSGDISGSGVITLAAPNTNSTVTLTLPTASGTINTSGSVNEVPAGTVSAPSIYPTGDTNTGIFFPAADTIAFSEGGAEAMRIDSSGNVGIGTSSPNTRLQVATGGDNDSQINITSGGDQFKLSCFADGTAALETVGAFPIRFLTSSTERARIDASGNLLVGTTENVTAGAKIRSVYNANAGNIGLSIQATVQENGTAVQFVNASGSVCGTITQDTTSTAYNTSSDYRLKENVAPMQNALATVAALKPCTYTWKVDGSAGQGFIAHELQEVVPDCVTGEKDAVSADGSPMYQGVDTSFLVATLVAAIQELTARLEAVENK
jgi:hypothetical protein